MFDNYSRLPIEKSDNHKSYSDSILDSNNVPLLPVQSESEEESESESERSDEGSSEDEATLLRNVSAPAFTPLANLNALTGQPGFFSATPLPTFVFDKPPEPNKNEAPPDYKE